jgi:adenylyl- and sulfurtransferase ThiI
MENKRKVGRPKSPHELKIISFNVRKDFEPTLRQVVKEAYDKFKNENP